MKTFGNYFHIKKVELTTNYTQIPNQVFTLPLTQLQKLVLIYLFSNSESFRITKYRISKAVNADYRTVEKALEFLIQEKMIEVVNEKLYTINVNNIINYSSSTIVPQLQSHNYSSSTIPTIVEEPQTIVEEHNNNNNTRINKQKEEKKQKEGNYSSSTIVENSSDLSTSTNDNSNTTSTGDTISNEDKLNILDFESRYFKGLTSTYMKGHYRNSNLRNTISIDRFEKLLYFLIYHQYECKNINDVNREMKLINPDNNNLNPIIDELISELKTNSKLSEYMKTVLHRDFKQPIVL